MQNFFHVGTYLRGIYLSRVYFIYVVDNLVIDDDDDDDTCVLAVRVVEPLSVLTPAVHASCYARFFFVFLLLCFVIHAYAFSCLSIFINTFF